MPKTAALTAPQRKALLQTLQTRFEQHMPRHPSLSWAEVRERLENQDNKLRSLAEMEATGGEPDVVGRDPQSDAYLFVDCAAESPKGRRSVCYDRAGLESRRGNAPPADTAVDMAAAMGIELLTEAQYRELQTLGEFDLKTSSWVQTPDSIRQLGGALFCDRRYGTVFTYHNGAQSYYAARGFRGALKV